jgi:hypothetical protein
MSEELSPLAPGDECMKLLDNGWMIQLFINQNNKYTAVAIPPSIKNEVEGQVEDDEGSEEFMIIDAQENWIVTGQSPTSVLRKLTDSALFGRKE